MSRGPSTPPLHSSLTDFTPWAAQRDWERDIYPWQDVDGIGTGKWLSRIRSAKKWGIREMKASSMPGEGLLPEERRGDRSIKYVFRIFSFYLPNVCFVLVFSLLFILYIHESCRLRSSLILRILTYSHYTVICPNPSHSLTPRLSEIATSSPAPAPIEQWHAVGNALRSF